MQMYYMEREVNQVLWTSFMGALGHGWDNIYNNDTFEVRAYCWNDEEESNNEWHFWHKPSGLKVCWYKYPLRGCTCNMPGISHEFFLEVLKDCSNSVERDKDERVKFLYDVYEWWGDVNDRI